MTTQAPRLLAGIATLALAAVVLGGCGGSPPEASDTGKEPAAKAPADKSADAGADAGEQGPASDEAAVFWSNTAGEYGEGTTIDIHCPAGGTLAAQVWGGDNGVYTDDSAICVAAVHAGLITVEEGGDVVIEKTAGQDDYGQGSTANGVTSLPWPDPWSGSFIFPEA